MSIDESFFTPSQVKVITSVIVAGVVAGIGYWQWPQKVAIDNIPIRILMDRIVEEQKHIQLDLETLQERFEKVNTLQQIVLERWDVQGEINIDLDKRMDYQERKE